MRTRPGRLSMAALVAVLLAGLSSAQPTAEETAKLEKQRCPRPGEFALVFSLGYGSDMLPKDDGKFEALLKKLAEGGFNTVHGTYTAKRLELCKKHGLKLMVDLLAPEHHVYKSPDRAKEVCATLRDNPTVWGYNIWNDPMGKSAAGRRRDVNNVRLWDPTHPAHVGTYRNDGMSHLANADLLGYYDFHWKRGGPEQHIPRLLSYLNMARARHAWYYTWLSASSGRAGKGNFNRNLYSANTGIACGLKGILWFLGTELLDVPTLEWTAAGKDIVKVQAEIAPLAEELAKIGLPTALYSTPITRTANNDPLPGGMKERMPSGLAQNAFPQDFFLQPRTGEVVVGVFQPGPKKTGHLYVANHNAYAGQTVEWRVEAGVKLERFARPSRQWETLENHAGGVRFTLPPGGGELLRFSE